MYVCIYIYMCMYILLLESRHTAHQYSVDTVFMCIFIYEYKYVYMYIFVYVCMCVHVRLLESRHTAHLYSVDSWEDEHSDHFIDEYVAVVQVCL